jgi:ABC-type polar amino acid transport system ATPase subunit
MALDDVIEGGCRPPSAHPRLRLPGLQPDPRPHRARECGPPARTRRLEEAQGSIRCARCPRYGRADRADHYPDDLSGGQQQRVAIARAVVGTRRIILADEPTGALDSTTGELVLKMLRRRVDAGAGGILVTHDARHAAWADRIIFLRDGRIIDQSAPAGVDALLSRAPGA